MLKTKKYFYFFIHFNFMSGFLYAFWHFINTPKQIFMHRRLWAYESWIIASFYSLFVYLTLTDKDIRLKKATKLKKRIAWFKEVLTVNLILLIFPWGLFLVLSPKHLSQLLSLGSFYWRILGVFSLLGSIIYYFPYRFYKKKISYYILLFGAVDNFIAGAVITILFLLRKIPLVAFSAMPLLFYFSFFFWEQTKTYKAVYKK